jgi:anti-sigma factor RsiW
VSTDELACEQLVELLSDHLDGTLSEDDRRHVIAHLSECDGCTAALEQMRETLRIAGTLTVEPVPGPERERTRMTYRTWQQALPPTA